ncbi:LPS biosynthesis protein [Treponema pedis]|uniref:LPS biosynthesis protein n=1 Tax=Treponema pedis TaxID=409322 RepID=UPI00040A2B3E|nr:LPS biosynthesis protein [Treponema pedis]
MSAQSQEKNDEISLLDLFVVVFKYKKMIILTTVCAAVFILIYSVISLMLPPEKSFLPNIYKSTALMLIKTPSASSAGGLSSKLESSGLGDIASLMGFGGASGPSYSKLAAFLATTNSLLDAITEEFNIIEKYKIEKNPKTNARKIISRNLKAALDEKTGVFAISYEDIDPEFAKNVTSFCVKYYDNKFMELGLDPDKLEKENVEAAIATCLNDIKTIKLKIQQLEERTAYNYSANISEIATESEHLRMELETQKNIYNQLKIKFEILKIKVSSEHPVLQVIEYPEVPESKSKPSRGMLCIIVTFAAFLLSLFMAFVLNAVKNIKNDPEALAKLKGTKK